MRAHSPVLVVSMFVLPCLYGCGSTPAAPASSPAPTVTAPQASAASTAPTAPPSAPAESSAHRQLMWVVAAMAHAPSDGDIAEHFSPTFLSQVPSSTVISVFKQVMPGAPYTLEAITPAPSDPVNGLSTTARSAGGAELSIDLDVDAAGLIRGLLIKPKATH